MMKYSLLSIFITSLLLVGCGGDNNDTQNDVPKPAQSNANTIMLTLGSNNNVVNLNNVAQATFSTEDAKNNPVITIQKTQDKELVEPFNWAKQILDIENGSDYEVTLASSKPLSSTIYMELSVPADLIRALNDQNALAAYIVVDGDDSEKDFFPITSTYNPETQKLLVTVPDWALQADDSDKPVNVMMKIGLAKAITDEPATLLTTMARILTLPTEGESVQDVQNAFKLICPVKELICTETSRYGARKPGTVGKSKIHKGIDFRATSANSLIAATAGTVIGINKANGSIALRVDGGKSTIIYRHMSEIDQKIKVMDQKNNISGEIATGTILGKAGKVGVKSEHLHLEFASNNALLVCKGKSAIDRTCKSKITAPIDPLPFFVNSTKLVKTSPQNTSITAGQKFNLELQGFDLNGKRIKTEIDNRYSESIDAKGKKVVQPQGSLRSVNWSVNPASVYKVESDAKLIPDSILGHITTNKDDSTKLSSATVTVNQEESATITAYWDGLDNLKAEYRVDSAQIYSISPVEANLGQVTTFSVSGVGLTDILSFSLPNCINVTKLGGTNTKQNFSCKPTAIGKLEGTVKGAIENFNFTVDIIDKTEMQVKLLGGSYYHIRSVCQPSDGWCQAYHAHLLNLEVSAPVYSVVFPSSQSFDLNCGAWKKISYFIGGGCVRTEDAPPTVTMSWKMLAGCGGEGCYPYALNVYIERYLDIKQEKFSGEYQHFNYITSSLNAIEFSQVNSEKAVEYYSFF